MYKVKEEGNEHWAVIDGDDNFVCNVIYYERLTEFEALTIAEILNSGCDVSWDAVSADWRWAVALQIEKLKLGRL